VKCIRAAYGPEGAIDTATAPDAHSAHSPSRAPAGVTTHSAHSPHHPVAADGSEPQHPPANWSTLAVGPDSANVVAMDAKREAGAA